MVFCTTNMLCTPTQLLPSLQRITYMVFSIRLKITCHGKRGGSETEGLGEGVVVHTKAFPVPKIYGTKSPLTKRQLWVLLYVGSCITVITTLERGLPDDRGASDGRRGAVCLWPRRGVDVMQTARAASAASEGSAWCLTQWLHLIVCNTCCYRCFMYA